MTTLLEEIGWMDTLAFGAVALLVIRGFVRGCSGEVGGLLALAAALTVGIFGFTPVSQAVLSARLFHENPAAGRLVVFILLLVVSIAVWLAIGRLIREAIRLVVAQPFDAILGGMIGGFKAFVLVAVACAFGLLNPNEAERARFQERSATARGISPLIRRLVAADLEQENRVRKPDDTHGTAR